MNAINEIMSCRYDFNSDKYSSALNDSVDLYKYDNALDIFFRMSKSMDLSIIFALSFILEHTPKEFLILHKVFLADVILNGIERGYFRANLYFMESFIYVMHRDVDYFCYVDLLIKSSNSVLQNEALYNIFSMDFDFLKNLDNNTLDLDFSCLYTKFLVSDIEYVECVSLVQAKIFCMACYKLGWAKLDVYNKMGGGNPDLFDFIYFLPN